MRTESITNFSRINREPSTKVRTKSAKNTPVKQVILTALLVGFGMMFTPLVWAQPLSNDGGQSQQDSQSDRDGGEHGGHGGHGPHSGH